MTLTLLRPCELQTVAALGGHLAHGYEGKGGGLRLKVVLVLQFGRYTACLFESGFVVVEGQQGVQNHGLIAE